MNSLLLLSLLVVGCDDKGTDPADTDTIVDEYTTDDTDVDTGPTGPTDADDDGYSEDDDCDDTDALINPGASERCDEVDNDCDTAVDEDATDAITYYIDSDEDGYGVDASITNVDDCAVPDGYVDNFEDCDDTDAALNQDDTDGDGFSTCSGDCDDTLLTGAGNNPDADEICDDIDNDCDDAVDEESTDWTTWYADADEDGEGDAAEAIESCDEPAGYVADATDCDDTDAALNTVDLDGDAITSCDGDCDEDDPGTSPGADEICDGVDNDCDGAVDEESIDAATWYADGDGDTYGDPSDTLELCDPPDGYVSNGDDCDDATDAVSPDATEVCDTLDNDCDELVDDGDDSVDYSGEPDVYPDMDADSYGDLSASAEQYCDVPGDYVEDNTDCDDGDQLINPGETEEVFHDGVDQDCDGFDGYLVEDLAAGDLIITEIMQNPRAVSDADGEWFEIYNNFGESVDLEGMDIYDDGSNDLEVIGQLVIEADSYMVFGANDDSLTNGGVAVDYRYGGAMSLGNSDDELYLANGGGVIDAVLWDGGDTFPDPDGASMSLGFDALDAAANDDGGSWCEAAEAYGDGDLGSPGAESDVCPPESYNVGWVADLGSDSTHYNDYLLGVQILLTADATLTSFGVIGVDSGKALQLALYSDDGGNPGDLVAYTDEVSLSAGFNEFAVDEVSLSAGAYYIMAVYEEDTSIRYAATGGDDGVWYTALTYGSALPDPFPTPIYYTGQTMNYYVVLY